ncbi:hypothetical protein BFJ70_g16883 [Fusarium oxysporum]|nr:hypothetical protein BFJ70_g16883 [Fusarium oxysporum]
MAMKSPEEKLPNLLFPHPSQHEHDSSYSSQSESSTATATEKSQDGNEADNQDERIEMELHRLARTLSGPGGPHDDVMFPCEAGSNLDPNSSTFEPRKWANAFVCARTAASHGIKPRTARLAFNNLSVYGFGTATDYQKTVGNAALEALSRIRGLFSDKKQQVDILQDFEGLVEQGEMLCVLGPPGSGCSTLLKTIDGDTYGFHVGEGSTLNYQGIRPEQIKTTYRGESIYTAEVDVHFPHLTVRDALYFAAMCVGKSGDPPSLQGLDC